MENVCKDCGGETVYYDTVKRIVRYGGGVKKIVYVERQRCTSCGRIHRVLPSYILPFIHYEKGIVLGCVSGTIGPWMVEYEDRPVEVTIARWKTRKIHIPY